MVKHIVRQSTHIFRRRSDAESGQALVEYVLIVTLVIIAFGVAAAMTGPAIGNVFGNVVFNLIGQEIDVALDPVDFGDENSFWATVTWVADHPQGDVPFESEYTPPGTIEPTPISFEQQTQNALDATSTSVQATDNYFATSTQNAINGYATQTANYWNTETATNVPPSTPTEGSWNIPFVEQGTNANRWVAGTPNPDDVFAPGDPCQWSVVNRDADSASRTAFLDNAPVDSWAANRTCYLEIRGRVNVGDAATNPNPRVSFWHMWDLSGASTVEGTLQVTNWVDAGDGSFDRAAAASTWVDVPLISGTTTNYNWSRVEIDLRSLGGLTITTGDLVFRFKLASGGASSSLVRWYIDDFQVVNEASPTNEFGLDQVWDLNSPDQMDDFVFTADSARTIQRMGQSPAGSWRWTLTGNVYRSGMAWDDSPFGDYPIPTEGTSQAHQLRLKYPVDVTTAPITDYQGDAGQLVMSFYYAYDVPYGTRLEVQYTTDVTSLEPAGWTTFADGLLLDFDDPAGAPATNQQTTRLNLAMQFVDVSLEPVKDAPFRIRFLMTVNAQFGGNPTTSGEGWYIDDIAIERRTGTRFRAYPFNDHAEAGSITADNWIGSGTWGPATDFGGFEGTSTAYADTPNTDYALNTETTYAMTRLIDLLNDTVAKPPEDSEGARPAADRPFLQFWHQRDFRTNVRLYVDLWTERRQDWEPIWSFNGGSDTPLHNDNGVWERVEIDLREAAARANRGSSGNNWQWSNGADPFSITGNSDDIDDDIRIRFRMQVTSAGSPDRGVYIDNITIGELPETDWKLWGTAGGGDGDTFEDNIDAYTAGLPSNVYDRWWTGAFTEQIVPSGCPAAQDSTLFDYRRTASGRMLTDTPTTTCLSADLDSMAAATKYNNRQLRIVEMRTVVDLTSTPGTAYPGLYYWTRMYLDTADVFSVQIAVEDTDTGIQAYNNMAGWGAWTTVGTQFAEMRRHTWHRMVVDLRPYIGERIRIRFVLETDSGGTRADGIYLDGVRVSYRGTNLGVPFTNTQSALSANWVSEGVWGAGQDFFFLGGLAGGLPPGVWTESVYGTTDLSGPTLIAPITVPEINKFMGDGAPFSGGPTDNFSMRWERTMTLTPGTYTFSVLGDDGYRLFVDDDTGTDIGSPCVSTTGFCIIEDWTPHATQMITRTITVSTALSHTYTLEFFENSGAANIAMNASTSQFSFTDSPNPTGGSQVYPDYVRNSVTYGDSALVLNGYINTSAVSGVQSLYYRRIYWLGADMVLYTEISDDGGFTWSTEDTVWGYEELLPVAGDDWTAETTPDTWDLVTITLPEAERVMIRFRLETFSSTDLRDGVYISDIRVE